MIRLLNVCFDEEHYKGYSEKDFVNEIKDSFGSIEKENISLAKEAYLLMNPISPPAKGKSRSLNTDEGAE